MRELRKLDPNVDTGETLLPECRDLDETVYAEQRSNGFGFSVLGAIACARDEMIESVRRSRASHAHGATTWRQAMGRYAVLER